MIERTVERYDPERGSYLEVREIPDTVIITRHAGLVEWLRLRAVEGEVIAHATPDEVWGRHVIGALPLHLAALAADVTTVDLPGLPAEWRGRDLTPAEMDECGATLRTYVVLEVER